MQSIGSNQPVRLFKLTSAFGRKQPIPWVAPTHPTKKKVQPTGMHLSDRLDNSSGSKQPCFLMKPKEPAACKPALKNKSTQGLNLALWPSLEPSSLRAQSDGWIGKKDSSKQPLKRAGSMLHQLNHRKQNNSRRANSPRYQCVQTKDD